jgi:hypothetical protein
VGRCPPGRGRATGVEQVIQEVGTGERIPGEDLRYVCIGRVDRGGQFTY